MKLANVTNALIEIQANMKKDGDFEAALKVAEIMVDNSHESLVIVEADDCTGEIVMSAVWNHFQKEDWVHLFKEAKKQPNNQPTKKENDMSIQGIMNQQAIDLLPRIKAIIGSSSDHDANQRRNAALRLISDSVKPIVEMTATELSAFEDSVIERFNFMEKQ